SCRNRSIASESPSSTGANAPTPGAYCGPAGVAIVRNSRAPRHPKMTSQGTAHGRFQRAIATRNLLNAETAAREMGGLSLADALALCELLAAADPKRYERAALRWLQRFIDERLPPLTEVVLAAAALTELRHGRRHVGVETLKRMLRQG